MTTAVNPFMSVIVAVIVAVLAGGAGWATVNLLAAFVEAVRLAWLPWAVLALVVVLIGLVAATAVIRSGSLP